MRIRAGAIGFDAMLELLKELWPSRSGRRRVSCPYEMEICRVAMKARA